MEIPDSRILSHWIDLLLLKYFLGGYSLFSAEDQIFLRNLGPLVFKTSFSKKDLKTNFLNILYCKDGVSLAKQLLRVFSGKCFSLYLLTTFLLF
jgi:hypothetical protein